MLTRTVGSKQQAVTVVVVKVKVVAVVVLTSRLQL